MVFGTEAPGLPPEERRSKGIELAVAAEEQEIGLDVSKAYG